MRKEKVLKSKTRHSLLPLPFGSLPDPADDVCRAGLSLAEEGSLESRVGHRGTTGAATGADEAQQRRTQPRGAPGKRQRRGGRRRGRASSKIKVGKGEKEEEVDVERET